MCQTSDATAPRSGNSRHTSGMPPCYTEVMTCEVAVMNRRGIALAADSAVTLGDSKKIYHTAEKLFLISPSVPVGIMTFGCADMMDVHGKRSSKCTPDKLGLRDL